MTAYCPFGPWSGQSRSASSIPSGSNGFPQMIRPPMSSCPSTCVCASNNPRTGPSTTTAAPPPPPAARAGTPKSPHTATPTTTIAQNRHVLHIT
ncbi:hypothetical protein GCM10022221_26710 [Actinocorallia aurea]